MIFLKRYIRMFLLFLGKGVYNGQYDIVMSIVPTTLKYLCELCETYLDTGTYIVLPTQYSKYITSHENEKVLNHFYIERLVYLFCVY